MTPLQDGVRSRSATSPPSVASPCSQANEQLDAPPTVATGAASVMTEPADITACPSGLPRHRDNIQEQRDGGRRLPKQLSSSRASTCFRLGTNTASDCDKTTSNGGSGFDQCPHCRQSSILVVTTTGIWPSIQRLRCFALGAFPLTLVPPCVKTQ